MLVDTLGNLLRVVVRPAHESDRAGAKHVLHAIQATFPRLTKVWADQSYSGADFQAEVQATTGVTVEVVEKPKDQLGFAVVPKRWVVERTLAWTGRARRLSKDYERDPRRTEAFIYLASIHRFLKTLAPSADQLHRGPRGFPTQLALF